MDEDKNPDATDHAFGLVEQVNKFAINTSPLDLKTEETK